MAGNKNSKAAREGKSPINRFLHFLFFLIAFIFRLKGEPSTSGVSGKVFTRVAESTPKG